MHRRISTYLSQRSIAATALCAALVMWYVSSTTLLPAISQYTAIPEAAVEAEAPARAEAASVCTGMACSIDAKEGKGCCCAPKTSESSDKPEKRHSVTITKDCESTDALLLGSSRNTWSMPYRVTNLLNAPMTVPTAQVAHDSELLPAHPEEFEHIPILLCV